ncbi:sodium channel, voltage-gated, type I, beta a [Lampris incognitus]|uniref:sodium channel, voltage-gated, type I, beta a n=1 Tax=Lampris incognitus TaxID=2546036 RepID=UPI0024B5E1C0|nr:sodium channel, voltage-gated, type I, beta a [Lampris incognitus]
MGEMEVQQDFWLADIRESCILGLDALRASGAVVRAASPQLEVGNQVLDAITVRSNPRGNKGGPRILCLASEPWEGTSPETASALEELAQKCMEDLIQEEGEQHHIDTGNADPVRQRARRLPLMKFQKAEAKIQGMAAAEIIEPSDSPWASPAVLVTKKDGSLRFFVDYRSHPEPAEPPSECVTETLSCGPALTTDALISLCHAACVEVDSDTEAVANEGFKLGCISCKMRGEVPATATVDWYFMANGESEFTHIYSYEGEMGYISNQHFDGRLDWNGSKKTDDLQDGSIYILNVTYNDTGTYQCLFNRVLTFTNYKFHTNATKLITITVVPRLTRGMASILSEVMMYVSIIGLQLWLVVEMVYCYRKIAAAGEEALRESAAEYLAIASESKDNCAGVQVAE